MIRAYLAESEFEYMHIHSSQPSKSFRRSVFFVSLGTHWSWHQVNAISIGKAVTTGEHTGDGVIAGNAWLHKGAQVTSQTENHVRRVLQMWWNFQFQQECWIHFRNVDLPSAVYVNFLCERNYAYMHWTDTASTLLIFSNFPKRSMHQEKHIYMSLHCLLRCFYCEGWQLKSQFGVGGCDAVCDA